MTKALEILNDSVLKIDDLLPLFPEDAKVEDMKKHLCDCLDQYNSKILDLKQQLSEHSKSAEELRKKQRKQRHKHITINPTQECDLCSTSTEIASTDSLRTIRVKTPRLRRTFQSSLDSSTRLKQSRQKQLSFTLNSTKEVPL